MANDKQLLTEKKERKGKVKKTFLNKIIRGSVTNTLQYSSNGPQKSLSHNKYFGQNANCAKSEEKGKKDFNLNLSINQLLNQTMYPTQLKVKLE